ncbi:Uncharacterised protein [Neisseria canis]|uniref:Uncharacterized protein n=1 Tax=Neisseria canis TaxID=493 RepID=A0A3S4P5I7_9NEIS|nr:Uncharacterised protein [Neisseria canis]
MKVFFIVIIVVLNLIYFFSLYKLAKEIDNDMYFLDFITMNRKYESIAYKLLINRSFYDSHRSKYARLVKYTFLPSHISIAIFFVIALFFRK